MSKWTPASSTPDDNLRAAIETAREAYHDFNDELVVLMLGDFPPQTLPNAAERLLKQATRRLAEVNELEAALESAVGLQQLESLPEKLYRLLALRPRHARARLLLARLNSYASGEEKYRFSADGELLPAEVPGDPLTGWGYWWKPAVAAFVVVFVLGVALMTPYFRRPGSSRITIDPDHKPHELQDATHDSDHHLPSGKPRPSASEAIATGTMLDSNGDHYFGPDDDWLDLLAWSEQTFNWSVESPQVKHWTFDNRRLRATPPFSTNNARFTLPAVIEGSYRLQVEFTRHQGESPIGIFFPVGPHLLRLELGLKGDAATLEQVVDETRDIASTARVTIKNGQRTRVRIQVQLANEQASVMVNFGDNVAGPRWAGPLVGAMPRGWGIGRAPQAPGRVTLSTLGGPVSFHTAFAEVISGRVIRDIPTMEEAQTAATRGIIRLTDTPAVTQRSSRGDVQVRKFGPDDDQLRQPVISPTPEFAASVWATRTPSKVVAVVPAKAQSFSVVGLALSADQPVVFEVNLDGKRLAQSSGDRVAAFNLPVTGPNQRIELIARGLIEGTSVPVLWSEPRFHRVPDSELKNDTRRTGSLIGPAVLTIPAGTTGVTLVHNPQEIERTPTQDSLTPCHEFLFAPGPSSIVYNVPPGEWSFSAIGYCLQGSPARFSVLADGEPLVRGFPAGYFPIRVNVPPGTESLELRITPAVNNGESISFWCYPRLTATKTPVGTR